MEKNGREEWEMNNDFVPFASKISEVIPHTDIEYTFRMEYRGRDVKPGQFFEVSIPKYGEAPISVSGIGEDFVDLTIRRVGRVTDEVFGNYEGDTLLLRGPYGNGFNMGDYEGQNLIVIAGGTGLSPVKAVVDYFAAHPEKRGDMTLICGFKSRDDILFRRELKEWDRQMELILTVDSLNGRESKEEMSDDSALPLCREGLVTKYIPYMRKYDLHHTQAIVVGPPAMMRFSVAGLLDIGMEEKNIWISHERKMCCGLGKCGHCRVGDTYICLDGPVFNYREGKKLID